MDLRKLPFSLTNLEQDVWNGLLKTSTLLAVLYTNLKKELGDKKIFVEDSMLWDIVKVSVQMHSKREPGPTPVEKREGE